MHSVHRYTYVGRRLYYSKQPLEFSEHKILSRDDTLEKQNSARESIGIEILMLLCVSRLAFLEVECKRLHQISDISGVLRADCESARIICRRSQFYAGPVSEEEGRLRVIVKHIWDDIFDLKQFKKFLSANASLNDVFLCSIIRHAYRVDIS